MRAPFSCKNRRFFFGAGAGKGLSIFFPLSVQGPTRRHNSTGLAELWGGWPIELVTLFLWIPGFTVKSNLTTMVPNW